MQELKASCITTRSYNTCFCYDKDEVDAVLAEKDAFIKTLGEGQAELACEIERLKTKLEDVQASTNAETAFMAFGLADADEAFAKAMAERAIKEISYAVVWEAFNILNELRKEGKIKEDE